MLHAPLALALVLAQAAGVPAGRDPCADAGQATKRDAWDRARAPHVTRFCDLLAQAEARLADEPAGAEAAANEADKELPGRPEPVVLRARAASAVGRHADAITLFRAARAIDPRAATDAPSLLALATSLARTGDDAGAREAFRALVPKSAGIPRADRRARALLDAGLSVLGAGPAAAEEAVAVLRAASASAPGSVRAATQAALALALDRAGRRAESGPIAAEAASTGAVSQLKTALVGAPASEALAVGAKLEEARDPVAAAAAWDAVAAKGGPWGEHARARAAELRKGGAPRRRGR